MISYRVFRNIIVAMRGLWYLCFTTQLRLICGSFICSWSEEESKKRGMVICSPVPLINFGHKMVTLFRTLLTTTYPNSLYDNMGDTGLEPVTPCLSSKYRVFSTIFPSAWFNVCYDAIIYCLKSYNFVLILLIPVGFYWFRWKWLRFDYGLTIILDLLLLIALCNRLSCYFLFLTTGAFEAIPDSNIASLWVVTQSWLTAIASHTDSPFACILKLTCSRSL